MMMFLSNIIMLWMSRPGSTDVVTATAEARIINSPKAGYDKPIR